MDNPGNGLVQQFRTISLEECSQASLLDRVDSKFIMRESELTRFLSGLESAYRVMAIDGESSLGYNTLYFDSPEYRLYTEHHNGKLNRLKFRTRQYSQNGQVFNEIKRKINKGKTFKSRQRREELHARCDESFQQFIQKKVPGFSLELEPKLYVKYDRITLVANDYSERITIDTGLTMSHDLRSHRFENLAIIELKRDRAQRNFLTETNLKMVGALQSGFSKYCLGIVTTGHSVKLNNFKTKLRMVEKMCAKGAVL